MKIVFRHQPLPFHPNAMPAAKAAMAANKFGKFWQFHDLAFENQRDLGPEKYEAWAKQIGLDVGKWKAAMESKEIADQIQQDMNDGNKVGANGTPAFYINGRELSGAQPFPAFKAVIDEEIKKADELLKKGVKLEKIYDEITNVKAPPAAAPSAAPTPTNINVEVGTSPFKGGKNAQVKIFEFSDFQ